MELKTNIERLKLLDSKNSFCGYIVKMDDGKFNWETHDILTSCYSSEFLREVASKLEELEKNFALD